MCPQQVKALFFDIDGTLASSPEHIIHPLDIESLEKLHKSGYMLFIATGRDLSIPEEAKILTPVLPLFTGFVHINGQHCYLADGTEISQHPIADEDFLPLRAACEQHHLSMLYRVGNVNHLSELTFRVKRYWAQMGLPIPEIRPMDPDIHDMPKLCIHASPEDEEKYLKPHLNHTWTARITEDLIDLIPIGIGKSSGLRDVCGYFHIDPSQTMCFGDGQNDLDLIQAAGIGVAMGNAAPNIKDEADYVTKNANEAGITHALRHFGLI